MSEELQTESAEDTEILRLPGRQSLDIEIVRLLSKRSNLPGIERIVGHFSAMGLTGTLVWLAQSSSIWFIPAMVLHGCTIVTMFAPMHECVHKSAFKSQWLNETIGWLAGALLLQNSLIIDAITHGIIFTPRTRIVTRSCPIQSREEYSTTSCM